MKKPLHILFVLFLTIHGFGQVKKSPAISPESAIQAAIAEAAEAYETFDFEQIKINQNNLTGEAIAELRTDFLPAVKPLIVGEGDYRKRLARTAAPVFQAHRSEKSETVVFTHSAPLVFTWKETFVTFSTAALDLLADDEIAALVAHEIGHLYYAEALGKARDEKDDRTERIIELRCDLIAFHTLSKLNIKESNLISAVKKLVAERDRMQINSFQAGSPSLESRERLYEIYKKAGNKTREPIKRNR